MTREFLTGLELPEAAVEAILAEHERAVQQEQSQHAQAMAEKEQAMQDLRLDFAIREAIGAQGGRNHKAIAALLDTDALAAAEDPRQAAMEAVAAVKKECGYLFEMPMAPLYAPGTGAAGNAPMPCQDTLAGALRERFERR